MPAIITTYEQLARERKVAKLVAKLKELGWDSEATTAMDDLEWGFVATLAECAPPNSDTTKVAVIAALRQAEAAHV